MENAPVSAQDFFGTDAPKPVISGPQNNMAPISAKEFFGDSAPQLVPDHPAAIDNSAPLPEHENAYMRLSSTLGSLGVGLDKGILSTLKGAGTLGTKILDAFSTALTGKKDAVSNDIYRPETETGQKATEFVTPQNTPESIGKGAEQIAEWFIPAGKVNTVEKILAGGAKTATLDALTKAGLDPKIAEYVSKAATLGTKMGVRATEGGAIIGTQTGGDVSQVKTAAEIGGALPVVGAVAKPILSMAGDAIGGALKRVGGAISGRGTSVIDEIVKNPKAALQGISGEPLKVLSQDSQKLKNTVVNLKIAAGKEHERVLNNLQQIFDNEGKSFDKGTELNKISDLLESQHGIAKAEDGTFDFNMSRYLDKDATIINRAFNIIKNYPGQLNPRALDSLASKVQKLESVSGNSDADYAIHDMVNSLRDSMAKMGESVGYKEGADMARNYAVAMDKINNFTTLFKATPEDLRPRPLGEKFNGPSNTPIPLTEVEKTKISNDLTTLFSGNKDIDKDVLKKLVFGGQEIVSRQAGRTIATASDRASTKLGDFLREVVISPLLSPKKIGIIAARLSMAKEKVPQLIKTLKGLDPAIRGSIIEYLSGNH